MIKKQIILVAYNLTKTHLDNRGRLSLIIDIGLQGSKTSNMAT